MSEVPLREYVEALLAKIEKAIDKAEEQSRRELESIDDRLSRLDKAVSNLEGRALILGISAGVVGAVVGGLVAKLVS